MRKSKTDVRALHLGALKALKRAVIKAIAKHEEAGVPAAVWRDGKVVFIRKHRRQ